jgi:ureidoglycolate lyase
MNLVIEALTKESFAPFGTIIERPTHPHDASGSGWQWWGEQAQLLGGDRPYAIGYLDLKPAPLVFDWAEHHALSDELIIPLGEDCLVYVAPPHAGEPTLLPPMETFRAFHVRPGQAVLLAPGVWHGAPLAIYQPLNVLVLLLHNTGQQDTHIARFAPVLILRQTDLGDV